MKKKIIHCIHYIPKLCLENGGVVRFIIDICQVLSDRGLKVTLITQDAKDVPVKWYNSDFSPNVLELKQAYIPGGFINFKNLNKVKQLFNSDEIKVINFHIPWVLSNFQLARLADKLRIPYIVTPHGSLDSWSMSQKKIKKNIFWLLFGKKHYENAFGIHYTAESEREQGEKYITKNNSHIIPCLFDISQFETIPDKNLAKNKYNQISSELPNLLFLSRIHPKKGIDILIKAANILVDRGVYCNILIAGPDDSTAKGYRKNLEELVEICNLSDRVHFIGMVKGQEKLSLYNCADVFVLPTHQENFGFVLVEAMACATPVITSFGVDIWREIEKGGALITNNTPEAFAEKIEFLLSDKNIIANKGKSSREWALSSFDAGRLADEYCGMYEQVQSVN